MDNQMDQRLEDYYTKVSSHDFIGNILKQAGVPSIQTYKHVVSDFSADLKDNSIYFDIVVEQFYEIETVESLSDSDKYFEAIAKWVTKYCPEYFGNTLVLLKAGRTVSEVIENRNHLMKETSKHYENSVEVVAISNDEAVRHPSTNFGGVAHLMGY